MITLWNLIPDDIPRIKSWPPYPPEFSDLDYSLRDGGWLDEYNTKAGTEIFVAENQGRIAGFSIISNKDVNLAEFRIALHAGNIGNGMGKTLTLLTLHRGFSNSDISLIRLIVRKNNTRARKMYENLRFRHTGESTSVINGRMVEFFTMIIDRKTFEMVSTT
jgi:diamine N-acetyltransferase